MIIVTGGAGFIGSVLVKMLNDMGKTNIVVVDRWEQNGKWLNLRGLHFENFIHADELFTHPQSEYYFKKAEWIFHLGACSATTEKDMDYLWQNNVLYSQKLFEVATQTGAKFLYASSAATYGSGEQGYSDDHALIPNLRPLNPYGYSKQLFDEWVLKQKRFPSAWYGVKFFNVYGPHEYHKERMVSVVYQAHQQIKEKGKVKLFKSHRDDYRDGEQERDFIYVKDAVRALIALMEHSEASAHSGIYNLGTGKCRTFKDLVHATFKALNLPPQIEYIDMPSDVRDQYQYHTEAQMNKFYSACPQFKFSTLEEGVEDYVKNYLHQNKLYLV